MDTSTAVEASSPTFSSSSSCSSDDEMYDVFLSFRGEDTRKTFTDHLYWRLKHARVDVFIDENEIRGEIIPDELKQIIERARISVIIFSRRYADSIWCLEELEKIMECRRTLGQIVLPIFYDVDLSDVREQTKSFAEAFQTLEERFHGVKDKEEKIQSWRKSLTEAAGLDSLVFSKIDGYEGEFIRKIIDDINRKLKSTCLGIVGIESSKQEISNYIQVQVGIDSRLQDISTHLDVGGSNDVRIIGIWGMGGMGKTTVAEAIFNKYHPSFEANSFLQNMRERKLVDLQEQLLFDIVKLTKVEGNNVGEMMDEIKKRLQRRKVLVILDDICHVDQLKALAIKRDSFGRGSRIVITTRKKHLLKMIEVDKICCLEAMNEVEALELLSLHAFKRRCPSEGFLELSSEVVGYCGGLPLALKVLGSSLYNGSTTEWRNALDKWKSLPPKEIHEKLKVSYDELPDNYLRDAFLDISCFFIGMDMNYVMQILVRRGFSPVIGLSVLLEESLLTVGEDNKLMMHDLVRDMGREIARAQSPNIAGERSRLWHQEDVKDVLRNKSGTEEIEALTLDLQESEDPSFSTEAFRRMCRLRLLKLNYVQLTGSYKHISEELRWLCWHGFPLEVIPKDFYQKNLVAIDMSHSKLIRVWEDSHVFLSELKCLHLSHSACLKQLPNFSRLPNLEELILRGCKRLLWDRYSMMRWLDKLKLLDLGYCNLTEHKVVNELCFLRSLKILRLDGNGFDWLPWLSSLSELEELTLNDCKNLRRISDLPKTLKFLKANYCTALESIKYFPKRLSMRELDLKDCRKLKDISDLGALLHSTETIHMEGCTNLSARFKEGVLKEWATSGGGGVFFSGNDIPSWFTAVVNENEIVYIDVPNCGIGALTVCVIYSSDDSDSSGKLYLTVANRTQRTAFSIFPMTVSGVTPHEDYLWLGRIPNNVLNLKGGDKVHARAEFLREEGKKHLKLKKTGLCLEESVSIHAGKVHEMEWESKPYTYPDTDDDAWPSKPSHNLVRKTTRLSVKEVNLQLQGNLMPQKGKRRSE
ncbi:disease resistance protein RPV1-like [Prunus dulcis]|nr:disease resistance protein RPV1-like [Prunus dulcis]